MHRRTLLAAAASLAAGITARPAAGVAMRRHMTVSPPKMDGAPGSSPMIRIGAMPGIGASINGRGPYTFGIDTGADGFVHLSSQLAQALALPVIGEAMASDPSGKNPIHIRRFKISALQLAGVTFKDLDAEGMPPLPGAAKLLDGILGMDLFDALTLSLDFKKGEVGLSSLPAPAADGRSVFAYEPGPTIRLPVTIGAATYEADLDTGNMGSPLLFPTEWIARLPTHGAPQKRGIAHSISQTVQMYAVPLDAPARVGAVLLPASEVAYPNVAPVANIGSKALQGMVVRIDRANRRVQFET